ncbi:hypothetical protein [Streptomyces sp. NPDC088725]
MREVSPENADNAKMLSNVVYVPDVAAGTVRLRESHGRDEVTR